MNSTLHFTNKITAILQKATSSIGIFCVAFLVLISFETKAQVNTYGFLEENTSLTYTPITGTDLFLVGTWDNEVSNVVLPFTFNFNGVGYTDVNVSSNGFITFGAIAPGLFTYIPLSSANTYSGAISAFGQNLLAATPTSSVSYTITGTAPNRVFIVQYKDAGRPPLGTGTGIMNFQIHLYEGSNVIEAWYDVPAVIPTAISNFGIYRGQVGLRGVNNNFLAGNVFNRKEVLPITNWIPTDPGTSNTSSLIVNANSYNNFVTKFTWTPPCYVPSALTASGLTFTTANIGWTAPAIAPANYQYEVRSSGVPGSGPVGLGASGTLAGTSTTATGLTEGFTYTLYVRSACGGSNNSTWVTGPTFTLPCTATTVPYELFPSTPINYTVPGLPACTINQNIGTGNNWVSSATNGVSQAADFYDDHLVVYGHPTNNTNSWFITKGIQLTAGATYQLSYSYSGSTNTPFLTNKMEVRYSTVGTAAGLAAGTQMDDHPNIKSFTTNYINFTPTVTDVYYFGFRGYSLVGNGNLYLGEIQLLPSTCLRPTGLTAPPVLISFNNATITWTAPSPSPPDGYAYYVNTTGVAPSNNTPSTGTVPGGTTLTVIPGLSPSTTYYVWVRSICGLGFGEWSTGTSFTTLTAPPVYCIPNGAGFAQDPNGITNVTMGSINNTTGIELPNYYGNYSGLTTNVAQGATVPVSITLGTGFTYDTNIWVDWNNDGDFVDVNELVFTGVSAAPNPSTIAASFTVPLTQPLGPRRLRIGGIDFGPFSDPCRAGTWQAFEDYTINVIVPPPALTLSQSTMPAQCGLTNSPLVTITSTLSDFDVYTWTPSTGVSGDPVSGYIFNTSVTTTYILTASQTSGAFSTNTATFTYVANETPTPITITTPDGTNSCVNGPAIELNAGGGIVANVLAFQENFNSGINGPPDLVAIPPVLQFKSRNTSTGGVPALAEWTVRPNGYPSWFAGNFNSNDNSSFVLSDSDAQGNGSITRTRLISPPIDLTAYTAAALSFFHHYNDLGDDAKVQVAIDTANLTIFPEGTDPDSIALTWVDLIDYSNDQGTPTNFIQAFLNLNPYVGNVIRIRFNYQATWGWGWAIDNFRIVGSTSSAIVWSPTTGLYNDAAMLSPYTGTPTSVVYASPTSDTVYTASATGPSPTFCQSTQTVNVTSINVVAGAITGGGQIVCDPASLTNLTLTGHTGDVIRWEYADDPGMFVGLTPIANTTTTLTPAQFGTFDNTRYFRAVVGNIANSCNTRVTSGVAVTIPTTVQSGTSPADVWSNGTPDITKRVIITGNYTVNSDISACSIVVQLGATMEVTNDATVTIENGLTVDPMALPGNVVFQNNTSLIQNSTSNTANSGSVRYVRNSSPIIQYDYTYWSSPVDFQIIKNFSPNTNNARFYTFDSSPGTYAWSPVSDVTTQLMDAAIGYIIRAPNTISTTVPAPWVGEFYGRLRNGTYTASVYDNGIVATVDQNRNLLGNPYPSAIDADLLWSQNATTLSGNFYFWTHNTPSNGQVYLASDYAQYNASGGVGTSAAASGINNTPPNGNIAAGQGFFAEAIANGTVTFNNSIRIAGNNDLFYRSQSIEKHRVWLNVVNNQGAFKQTLVGYIEGATDSRDMRFDGDYVETGNVVSLYSLLDQERLTIQGRALPFMDTDVVPLGFKTTLNGEFTIQLADFDGLFAQGQAIYLEDKLLNLTHDLRTGDYSFTTNAGTFEDRFDLKYQNSTLSVPTFNEEAIIVYQNNQTLFINSGVTEMARVRLMDVRGRLIAEKAEVNATEVQFSQLNVSKQVLLVQITTLDGTIVTKRVIY